MDISQIDSNSLLQNLRAGVVVHGADTQVLYANPSALRLLRLSQAQILGKDAFDPHWQFLDSHRRPMSVDRFPVNQVIARGEVVDNLEVGICDGSTEEITWVLCTAYPQFDSKGRLDQVVVTFVDVTQSKRDIPFERIVELATDAIVVTDADNGARNGTNEPDECRHRILYVNQAFERLTGYGRTEVIGRNARFLQGEGSDPATRAQIRAALAEGAPLQTEILNYSRRGRPYWLELNIVPLRNDAGEVTFFAALERDVTESKEIESKLRELATHDPLTRLLNRRGFLELARQSLDYARAQGRMLCVAMFDLDYFKRINDEHGHDAGDRALVHFASMVQPYFRASDTVGRMGGEEFAAVIPDSSLADAQSKLDGFRARLAASPLTLANGGTLELHVSIGVAALSAGTVDLDALIRAADQALYRAKQAGRNRVES